MSTRRLIAVALITGMVILVAGTVFLFRLPKQDQVPDQLPDRLTTTTHATTTTVR